MRRSSVPGASTLKCFLLKTKPLLAHVRFARYFCDQLVDRHRRYEEGQLDAKVRNVRGGPRGSVVVKISFLCDAGR